MMPGTDGFETCRRIKDEVVTSHIPVLLLTACSQDVERTEGYRCGADGYMTKPFDSQMLLARCEALIRNRRNILESAGKAKPEAPARSQAAAPAVSAVANKDIDDEFYNRFMAVVEAEIGNAEITVEDFADRLGMSRVQMYRKIKALTNYSPTEILRNVRLKRAAVLLKTTEATVSEICYKVGFATPSYFTKCYREYYGESPSDTQARTSKAKD